MPEKDSIVIRDIEGVGEMRLVEELQMEAWGREERDVVPLSQLIAARNVGGMVVGAFDGEELAGFAYGFLGAVGERIVFHSHMLAVKATHRNFDLGFRLKLAQRERVLARGLTRRMTWTFDPLQSLNAHFNIAKLGALSDTYKLDVYGARTSSFLHRNGTDRLFVTWLLDGERVARCVAANEKRANRERIADDERSAADFASATPLLRVGEDGTPHGSEPPGALDGGHATIEIPPDINSVQESSSALAMLWREATRAAFTRAMSTGYVVRGFARRARGEMTPGVYLLSRGRLEDFSS